MMFYLYNLHDAWEEKQNLSQHKLIVLKKLKLLQAHSAPSIVRRHPNKNVNTFNELYQIFLSPHWLIKSMSIHSVSTELQSLDIDLQGHISYLLLLMDKLSRYDLPIALQNFSYSHANDAQFNLSMHILFLEKTPTQPVKEVSPPLLTHIHDPFCSNTVDIPSRNTNLYNQLQTFTLSQLKMVGMIQQNNRRHAFVYLPNGQTIVVNIGSALGKERAEVIDIRRQFLKFKFSNNAIGKLSVASI